MPRFVLLRHEPGALEVRGVHWDFMIEQGGALRTWSLSEEPRPGQILRASAGRDHRLAYLDYEGPLSGGRGSVARVDGGEYELIAASETAVELQVWGDLVRGVVRLRREPDEAQSWRFDWTTG
jgi:hypothetical protein